jgi:hypothetical protein
VSVETPEDIKPLDSIIGEPKPAERRVPTKKAAPRKKVSVPKPRTEAEIRAEIEAEYRLKEEIREQIRAEERAKLEAELASRPTPAATGIQDLSQLAELEETPYVHITPGPGEIVIHFLDDGATIGSRLTRRGEELAVNPEKETWVNMTRVQQQKVYGRQLWAKGPWPYGGFDLTDPELTVEDKLKLIAITNKN